MPIYTALVTVLAVFLYFLTGLRVANARTKFRISPPTTTGNPDFERVFRVQMNTLEWMPIFLPLLWLFALYLSDWGAAALGLIWIAGRLTYVLGYSAAAEKRHRGFFIQGLASAALLIGASVGIVQHLVRGG